jgi:uncharacterized alpha-E superfamily protein
MSEYEDRLRAASTAISQKAAQVARFEVEKENAEAATARVKASLEEDFGIKTSDDLKKVRAELEADLEKAIKEVEQALADAEAPAA